jgi:hypothetical protein
MDLVCLAMLCASLLPSLASAQATPAASGKDSHFGVRAYFTPSWEMSDFIRDKLASDGEDVNFLGTEFGIGLARGSTLGGDIGITFVRKKFDDESHVIETDQDCFNQAQTICRPNIETTQFSGVTSTAVEVHWFKPIVTISERVQIGFNIAGGIGNMAGNVVISHDRFEPTGFNQNGPTGFRQVHEEEVVPAKDEILSIFPFGKIEAAGAVILAPGFKIQAAGGFNFPGIGFRVGAVYLIGAK